MSKKYEELGITDAFIFAKVMSNKEICKPVLEQILNIKIRDIEYLDYEETIQIAPGSKSIRLDIYVEDDKNTVFNLEMQTTNYEELPKRSRYYQDIIDLKLIEKGQSYDILKTSYVIFICTFDFFEKNRSIYEFENICVDDSEINREILKEILKEDYRILEAANGEECLEQLERYGTGISLVLLDIVMPEIDGFEVLAAMNQNHWIEDIPVIMISSEDSDSYIRRAYEMGVSDYISRPFDAKIVYQRVLNMIKLYAKQRRLIRLVTRQIYEKERNNRMLIGILSQIVEFRNGESGRHVIHINLITQLLLEQLVKKTGKYQLSWEDRFLIATASALHDIGKIGIDERILNKPGKLTKEEFEIMKAHTLIGAQMLDNLDMYRNEKLLKLAYEICRWHHERYDGKGYPDGLVGEEIPISAQVVSLADVYDALVSERVYKKAFSHEKALEMIRNGECGTFNPLLLQCMTEAQDKLKTMMEVAEE
mgnify:FL=1